MVTPDFIPPQFHPDDIPIWKAWWPTMEDRYDSVEYNIRLGGQKTGPNEDVKMSQMWEKLTARRVDAVGYTEGAIDLIEFRAFAGPSAIGQLIVYRALWKREKDNSKKINLVLVTDLLTEPISIAANDIGIETVIIKKP